MISNNSGHEDSGSVVDVGTLVVNRDEEAPQPNKELDFVSYAKGIRMVEELEKKPELRNELDRYANQDEEEEEEEVEDNSEEVLEKMTVEE